MDNAGIDRLLTALSREGFVLPYMAHCRDYDTPKALQAADEEAWKMNRESLRAAIREATGVGEPE